MGPLEVVAGGETVALGGAKARALLAFLLLNRADVVSRERLVDELWGERPPKTVAAELRVYIAKLRKVLPPDVLATRSDGYVLLVESEEVDAERFERAARWGSELLTAGDAATAAEVLAEALALWRGPLLADLADESWAALERRRLDEVRLTAIEERIRADLALGRHEGLIAELLELVSEHPYRERLRACLMLALYHAGRQSEALAVYRETAELFAGELGIQPGPELREVERSILNHHVTVEAPPSGNLPAPPTRLIGREQEVEEVVELLAARQARLVTLTGTGGSGKTRLALAIAARFERTHGASAFFVELAPVQAGQFEAAIAHALGAGGSDRASAGETLRHFLRGREVLLLLDNLEHLPDAGPAAARLLAAAPQLLVLATSRRPLRVRAEHCYGVEPLPIDDALQLFVERARAVRRDSDTGSDAEATCREICERVDRLPLAIELAAARVRLLDPEDVLRRLHRRLPLLTDGFGDADERHHTLAATIAWSFDLLKPEQKRLFTWLSVFPGSFSFEAAEAVCDADPATLAALVDASLVGKRGARFSLLETVREFAGERMDSRARADALRNHGSFFRGTAMRWRAKLYAQNQGDTIHEIDAELANLRLALEWSMTHDDSVDALGFFNAMCRYLSVRGLLDEGVEWGLRALRRDSSPLTNSAVRIEALAKTAHLMLWARMLDDSIRLCREACSLAYRSGDERGEVMALTGLAKALAAAGEDGPAAEAQKRSIAIATRIDDEFELAMALHHLGDLLLVQGDLDAAAAEYRRSAALSARLGDGINEAVCLYSLANAELHRGQHGEAIKWFREVLLGPRLPSLLTVASAIEGVAATALARDDSAGAARLLGASEAALADVGLADRWRDGVLPTVQYDGESRPTLKQRVENRARSVLGNDEFDRLADEGRALAPEAARQAAVAACGAAEKAVPRSHLQVVS